MSKEKCPVCEWELPREAVEVKAKGKTVRVCCDECAEKAKAAPEKYGNKGG